jgi:hypothetical protein
LCTFYTYPQGFISEDVYLFTPPPIPTTSGMFRALYKLHKNISVCHGEQSNLGVQMVLQINENQSITNVFKLRIKQTFSIYYLSRKDHVISYLLIYSPSSIAKLKASLTSLMMVFLTNFA